MTFLTPVCSMTQCKSMNLWSENSCDSWNIFSSDKHLMLFGLPKGSGADDCFSCCSLHPQWYIILHTGSLGHAC